MRLTFVVFMLLASGRLSLALTGHAPPAAGAVGRTIVMVLDDEENLCTGTVVAADVVLTAAHCVSDERQHIVNLYQTRARIPVLSIKLHPGFDARAYKSARATVDVALIRLAQPLPDIMTAAELAPAKRVSVGDKLTIAGFGVTEAKTPYGLGIPRQANLVVTGRPGTLQIRLVDSATLGQTEGLGACSGDSGGPVFDAQGRLVGVISWSTGPNDEDGCGGLTGITPLFLHAGWVQQSLRALSTLSHE